MRAAGGFLPGSRLTHRNALERPWIQDGWVNERCAPVRPRGTAHAGGPITTRSFILGEVFFLPWNASVSSRPLSFSYRYPSSRHSLVPIHAEYPEPFRIFPRPFGFSTALFPTSQGLDLPRTQTIRLFFRGLSRIAPLRGRDRQPRFVGQTEEFRVQTRKLPR